MTPPSAFPPTFFSAPADLLGWTGGAVAARLPATVECSHFPASVDGMLVFRTQGQVYREGQTTALPELALIGPSAIPMTFTHAGAICTHGLLLAPHTVSFLSGQFNGSISGQDLCLRTLFPAEAARLIEIWSTASDDATRCQMLFGWLRQLIFESHVPRATRWSRMAGLAPLLMQGHDAACAELGVGPRQLERLSRRHLGMTPHQAQTILRMRATLRSAMTAVDTLQGAELALSQGFFDQSHMGRDLKRLTGLPLGRAVAASRGGESTEWPLAVGKQQFSHPDLHDEPGTTAARMQAPAQNTSKHTARAGAGDAPAISRR